ncbi:MAG: 5'-methylthioadenosine/S-adenosylhomocysteine nucleosidase [Pseudothermotoga sp.]|uniref:5'-methylthioadenosine/S-adenosylhomocysteine nucleosidase n=1 Tax=Pseudothermotoga sp. TaxID=2033661 RepID=UPI002586D1B0|nr:5'-methylthioadenosine/S-adenosylhomocysteine nucleosidase [Pseudothermotoga sp.]MDI6863386.1 5'-methylthioadenosine/S-adenosylhomocysteine nucleosidase [Pseudothermotoga sp.]
MIAVVGVLPEEVKPLIDALSPRLQVSEILKRPVFRGLIGTNEVLITSGCVGKVETACVVQALLDKFSPDCVLLVGAAGALRQDILLGTLVAGTAYVEYDFSPRINVDSLINPSQEVFAPLLESSDVTCGIIASGDSFISSESAAKKIHEATGAICVDMDSAAAAKVCVENEKPFLSMKVIVDFAGSKAIEQYIENHPKYAPSPARLLVESLRNLVLI